ncbi:MAG: thrombospondin type 3 repeat-containing protein [Pseudomonadales bacterium]|nr:thrombospondin type 3 repeat-containing protein [Pseudomonadales bacterium]
MMKKLFAVFCLSFLPLLLSNPANAQTYYILGIYMPCGQTGYVVDAEHRANGGTVSWSAWGCQNNLHYESIPVNSTNVGLKAWAVAGETIFDFSYGTLDGNKCYQVGGTTLNTWYNIVDCANWGFTEDADADGVKNHLDNCPEIANSGQENNDGDAEGDACDLDDDNDGVPDSSDDFPFDATESVDTDNDGIGNNADLNDDNDGISDLDEIACGSDPLDPASICLIASAGESDFDADFDDDILVRNVNSNVWRLFSFQSGAVDSNTIFAATNDGQRIHQANLDVDGDGDKDVITRRSTDGQWKLIIVEAGEATPPPAVFINLYTGSDWDFVAAFDADADSDDDVLMRNNITGIWRLFTIQSGAVVANSAFNLWSSTSYSFAGMGDFDGDIDDDILLRGADGKYRLFVVEAGAVVSSYGLPQLFASSDYQFQVASDFDGDGDDDILIRNTLLGTWRIFDVQSATVVGSHVLDLFSSIAWSFETEGDFDGDGDADLLLRHTSGNWQIFTIDAANVTGNAAVSLYSGTDWQIQR